MNILSKMVASYFWVKACNLYREGDLAGAECNIQLIEKFTELPFAPKALLATIRLRLDDSYQAIRLFEEVIEDIPLTSDGRRYIKLYCQVYLSMMMGHPFDFYLEGAKRLNASPSLKRALPLEDGPTGSSNSK